MSEAKWLDVPLGFHGVIRVRASVAVEAALLPASPPVVVDKLKGNLPVKGRCTNLAESVPCQVVWLVAPEASAPFEVPHDGETVLAPGEAAGALRDVPFEVKQIGEGGAETLTFDVLRMGLYGRGKIGVRVLLSDVQGLDKLELSPEQSGLSFDTPLTVTVTDGDGQVWRGGDRTSTVGAELTLTIAAGQMFHGLTAAVELWESDGAAAEDRRAGLAFRWKLDGTDDSETFRLGVGAGDVPQFWYARGVESGETLDFFWEIVLEDAGGRQLAQARPVRKERFCTAPIPALTALTLTKLEEDEEDDDLECLLSGAFTGFSPELSFALSGRLYAHAPPTSAGPNSRASIKTLGAEFPITVNFDGTFEARLRLGKPELDEVRALDNGKVFGVVYFPQRSGPGGQGRPVFMTVARYQANAIGDEKDNQGFAPFRDGALASEYDGDGVCTDLLGLHGESSDLASDGVVLTSWTNGFGKNIADQNKFNEFILASAREFEVDPRILKSLIAQESEFNPRASRPTGSYAGLTQVSQDIAGRAGCKVFGAPSGADDRFDPAKAIRAGALGLSEKRRALHLKLGERLTSLALDERWPFYIAAYNLGEGTVLKAIELLGAAAPLAWKSLIAVEQVDVSQKERVLSATSPLGRAIVAQGWGSKLAHMRHYVEDMIARARQ